MWDHYLRLGVNEIANSARAYGYATTAECPSLWLEDKGWEGISDALGEVPYTAARIAEAPWFDSRDESTTRFYGVYVYSVQNIVNSTREASITEGITPGGVAGRVRDAGRSVRVRVWLTGRGKDALDTGETWLSSVLSGSACGMHGESCGEADLLFFSTVPPQKGDLSDAAYQAEQLRLRRHLHRVTCTSGPITVQERASNDGIHYGRMLEFTLYAGVPWVFSEPRAIALQPTIPSVIQDIPYNQVTHPSAELAGPTVVAATNYSINPSVETDAAGWEVNAYVISGSLPSPYITSERTTELSAGDGSASFRARLAPPAGSLSGRCSITLEQLVDISSAPAGSRFSLTIWGASFIATAGGGAEINTITAYMIWGDNVRTDVIDSTSTELQGRVFTKSSIQPPSGVQAVRVILSFDVSWASGNDIRVYADTLGVTVP